MGRRFHLVLVRPPGYVHSSALAEAIEYLAYALRACGHTVSLAENRLAEDAHNVVACAHLLSAEAATALPADTIILGSEPLADAGDWQFASGVYAGLLARHHVWDYSHANVALLPHRRASVIPYWHCPALARTQFARREGDRLLFYGVLTPRRKVLLEALAARGISIDVLFGIYGEARDRALRGARAVLNLHKHDTSAAFEAIRCFHPLNNDVSVISEETPDLATAAPFADSIVFVPARTFADDVAGLLADPARFRERAQRARARFAALDPLPLVEAAVSHYTACLGSAAGAGR